MRYFILFLLILTIPFFTFAKEPVNECFSTDDTYYKLSYYKNNKDIKTPQYTLFISQKNGNEKLTLYGYINKLSDKNKVNEIEFIGSDNKTERIILDSLKPKNITINDVTKPVNKLDCFTFLTSYDRYIDENGQSFSIYTKGKSFMENKFKESSYKPSFNCEQAETNLEKAICSNSEISYLDNLFHSMNNCYKTSILNYVDNKELYAVYLDNMSADFLSYRNKSYKSDNGTLSSKEVEQFKKAYMLGIIFTPMIISASEGDLYILGQKLFMSYYMLTTKGIKLRDVKAQKGFGSWYGIRQVYLDHYDELMYYNAGIYDNMNSRMPNLFYYIVYLQEKYGIIDDKGNFQCKNWLPQ